MRTFYGRPMEAPVALHTKETLYPKRCSNHTPSQASELCESIASRFQPICPVSRVGVGTCTPASTDGDSHSTLLMEQPLPPYPTSIITGAGTSKTSEWDRPMLRTKKGVPMVVLTLQMSNESTCCMTLRKPPLQTDCSNRKTSQASSSAKA